MTQVNRMLANSSGDVPVKTLCPRALQPEDASWWISYQNYSKLGNFNKG